jgi:hypothetical protein
VVVAGSIVGNFADLAPKNGIVSPQMLPATCQLPVNWWKIEIFPVIFFAD